jgi:hypothetical protein
MVLSILPFTMPALRPDLKKIVKYPMPPAINQRRHPPFAAENNGRGGKYTSNQSHICLVTEYVYAVQNTNGICRKYNGIN